ncbi:MAG: phosphatase PAP2 family protein [Candidatus Thermoplasmatota archaeon]|nr:phosphatase PAP2 family protein [Candidatus Thermoplasmatota archaeon]
MAAGTGIYITWITGAIVLSIAMMPFFKPSYAKLSADGFIDMFRRYWAHMIVVFSVYLWKDILDGMDRALMTNTQLDMTPYVYAIEGDIVLWVQQAMRNPLLDEALTHFYVMGFMTATFASFLYPIYFDDRHMADRVSLSMFWVYVLAIPFYLFFNVGVTGNHIPEMQAIAYDLTPEINNWFTRIDPFTNGMPSLHIGLPFAIWLTMQHWDDDGRWHRYRNFLMCFILLTALSIVYLGIHWVVDIIGGMVVAILAVQITSRTSEPIWKVADERLFGRRLSRAISDPGKWLTQVSVSLKDRVRPLKEPSRRQTSFIIAAVVLSTGGVLLWDATHQDFPLDGVEWPTAAAGSGGWLVSVEEDPMSSEVKITQWNVTSQEGVEIVSGEWGAAPSVVVSGQYMVLHDSQNLEFYNLGEQVSVPTPSLTLNGAGPILDVAIAEDSGAAVLVIMGESSLQFVDVLSGESVVGQQDGSFSIVAASGTLVAWVDSSSESPTVNLTSTSGSIEIGIDLDVTATEAEDEYLEQISGIPVNYSNATVIDIDMSSSWLVAVVDVGPVNRTALVDILSGDQIVLSDPLWQSSSPSIGDGRVAFLQIPFWDPTNPNAIANHDVYLHEIESNTTLAITRDDDVNQMEPQVLLEEVAWIEVDTAGESILKVYSGETFQPYSSVILQSAIVMLIPLLFLWSYQAASER